MAGGGASHGAHGSCVVEDVPSAGLHDLVHQVDQVRCLVCPLILLGEILNRVVYKVLENEKRLGGAFLVIMEELEELSGILLAVGVTVWLVQKLKSLDEDLKASLKTIIRLKLTLMTVPCITSLQKKRLRISMEVTLKSR